jgi:hypothetical protein
MVSLTLRPLYLQEKSPWYPLGRRLGGPQSRSGRGGEEKNSQPPPGNETWNPDRPARSPALYRLIIIIMYKSYMYKPGLSIQALRSRLCLLYILRAVQTTERSCALPPPSLSLLYFLCWASFFAYVSNIYIIMSLCDFCLLPTYFCYVIVNVRNLERQM